MAETTLPCVCGNTAAKLWATVNKINLVECSCGIIRVEKIDKEAYSSLYTSGHYHEIGSPDLPHAAAGREPHKSRLDIDIEVANARLNKLQKYAMNGKLIDVGCANGAYMLVAEDRGFDVEGVDLAKDAAPKQIQHLIRVGDLRRVGFQRRYADIITFNDSFEHFIDPLTALQAARGILKRDGILVIEIPDMGCADAKSQRENFKHVKPHEHLWYFTATQLRELLEANGFTVIGMDVPVAGKVTAYASPAVTVEEIEILGPPGIGDVAWTLIKLKGIREKESPCRIKYVVCVEGETKLSTRSKDFLLMCKYIDSVEFRAVPLPRDIGCEDPSIPRYELIANAYLEPQNLFLEDWRPELETDWDLGIDVPEAAITQAKIRLGKIGKCAVFYLSSMIWNQVVARPDWTPKDYAELFIKLADNGIKPVVIGAFWDGDYTDEVSFEIGNAGREPAKVFLNLIGRTPVALAMAYMKLADVTIGIANGLPMLATYMGRPSIILWPTKGVSTTRVQWGEEFKVNWVPPEIRKTPLYTALSVGAFTVDNLFSEIKTKIETSVATNAT